MLPCGSSNILNNLIVGMCSHLSDVNSPLPKITELAHSWAPLLLTSKDTISSETKPTLVTPECLSGFSHLIPFEVQPIEGRQAVLASGNHRHLVSY